MDSALIMVFMLSFASVTPQDQKEIINEVPFPEAPPTFKRVEKTEELSNDAEIFWEVTKTPKDVVDGNHPDNSEITTHDHVDQTIGHVPPTKRVKKILPPFERGKMRNARHIDSSPSEEKILGETAKEAENVTETPSEIQGIRLVPNETAEEKKGEEGEEDGGEEAAVEKSIWDLLRERVESSGNYTEKSTEKPKSLYEHFDDDSAEMEFETENFNGGSNIEKHELPISYAMPWLQMKDKGFDSKKPTVSEEIPQDVSKLLTLTENEKFVNGVSVIRGSAGDGRRPSKWYLLLLTGNSTIVKLRGKDFAKYLKLNLAARLSIEYDDVRVNKVILASPKVLVNVSVFAPSDDVAEESQLDFKISDKGEAALYKLAETNATLLELSGEEYHVIRFLSFESEKPEAEAHKDIPVVSITSKQNDVEFILYTFLGSACACAVLLALFVGLNRYFKRVSDLTWFKPKSEAWKTEEPDKDEFNGISPAVIYSGGFPQIRESWMTQPGPLFRHQHPTTELAASPLSSSSHTRKPLVYPTLEDPPTNFSRNTRLQIYNGDANSLVIPKEVKGDRGRYRDRSDTHPLDVRMLQEESGQDNPIFTN